ncbi:MAG TPA: MFS transporter [Polyangiaceae bacterium]|nr:MFS transporter [Polyangiaceae bacterium]
MQSSKLPRSGTWLGIGLVATAHFANDAVTSMVPALLPSLATRFRLEPADLALLVSVFAISTSLPQPFFGLLADRVGRRWVSALGLGVSAILIAALGTASSVTWLWLALLVGGLGSSALHPAGLGLARASASGSPGLAVAVFSSVGMAGGAVGPVLAIGVASVWGLEQLAWTAVPVALLALLLSCAGQRVAPAATQPTRVNVGRQLLKGPVVGLTVVALFTNLVMLTFTSAMPVWLVVERGFAETSSVIGITLATFSFAAAAGGILGGALARRVRPARLIVGSLATSVIALQGILLAAPASTPYFLAVASAGALLGLHSPLLIAKAQELTPGAESAVAGVLLGATSGAAGVIYAGLGAAQSVFGIGSMLAAVSLLVLPAAHLAAVSLRPQLSKGAPACVGACAHETHGCAVLAGAA